MSSQNTLAFSLDFYNFTELPSATATDGQDATFEISGTTYYGKWFSYGEISGWQLYETSDYSGDSVAVVVRVVITAEESELLHYNQRKLVTLTLNDGSTVLIGGVVR